MRITRIQQCHGLAMHSFHIEHSCKVYKDHKSWQMCAGPEVELESDKMREKRTLKGHDCPGAAFSTM